MQFLWGKLCQTITTKRDMNGDTSTCETLLPLKPIGNLTKKGSTTSNSRIVRTCSIKRISWKLLQNSQKYLRWLPLLVHLKVKPLPITFPKRNTIFIKCFFCEQITTIFSGEKSKYTDKLNKEFQIPFLLNFVKNYYENKSPLNTKKIK